MAFEWEAFYNISLDPGPGPGFSSCWPAGWPPSWLISWPARAVTHPLYGTTYRNSNMSFVFRDLGDGPSTARPGLGPGLGHGLALALALDLALALARALVPGRSRVR